MKIILIICFSLYLYASPDSMAEALLKAKITQQEILDDTYLTKLRDKNDPDSLITLALIYIEGRIESPNPKEAINLLFKASDKGSSRANFLLGLLYEEGQEVEQNFDLAEMFYKKSSSSGFAEASYNLAVLYHFGENGDLETRVNHKKAYNYYRRSLAQGKEMSDFFKLALKELNPY